MFGTFYHLCILFACLLPCSAFQIRTRVASHLTTSGISQVCETDSSSIGSCSAFSDGVCDFHPHECFVETPTSISFGANPEYLIQTMSFCGGDFRLFLKTPVMHDLYDWQSNWQWTAGETATDDPTTPLFISGGKTCPRPLLLEAGADQRCYLHRPGVTSPCCLHVWLPFCRVGEADNPGPLQIGSFNPGQIFNHESAVVEWGDGIWTASETSHTLPAMCASRATFCRNGINSWWSKPVSPHSSNAGSFRGKASGTAIFTQYHLQPYPCEQPDDVFQTSRLTEALVDIGEGLKIYVASLYGPTHNRTLQDPWALLYKIFGCACDHATAYQGPAVITGDLNANLQDIELWKVMEAKGWHDAALHFSIKTGFPPQATCRGNSRKTFILINTVMLQALESCEVVEDFSFDAHPLLLAKFDLCAIKRNRSVWSIPITTDHLLFDDELLRQNDVLVTNARGPKFQEALNNGDSDAVYRQFNLAFEDIFAKSCVDVVGNNVPFPPGCRGRGRMKLWKTKPPVAPCIPKARHGDFDVSVNQPSMSIRRRTRQVRRIHCLVGQLEASQKRGSQISVDSVNLWSSILSAPGYHRGFKQWILDELGTFVPLECPGVQYVTYLLRICKAKLQDEIAEYHKMMSRSREKTVTEDMARGGKLTFASTRDPQVPPFSCIQDCVTIPISPIRWKKEGNDVLIAKEGLQHLDTNFPISFQGQKAFVTKICCRHVYLDRRVINRDASNLFICQTQIVADPSQVHERTRNEWSKLWQREGPHDCNDDWHEAFAKISSLQDCPSCDFRPFESTTWKANVKCGKKSARGACGFSAQELLLLPPRLESWLFQFFDLIENGKAEWPKFLNIARVILLGKDDKVPVSPMNVRPITILPRLYRSWARFRALQVIQHLNGLLPPEIATISAGVSADCICAFVLDKLESAIEDADSACGVIVDLVKCYNLVPRRPLLAACIKFGVPAKYLNALWSMWSQLHRHLEICGEISETCASYTGIPEGCCFSVACMTILSGAFHRFVQQRVPDIEAQTYADNWSLFADCVATLRSGIHNLIEFVQSLRMDISWNKSWLWGSHSSVRKDLKTIRVNNHPIQVKLTTVDMGCDVSYCRRVTKKIASKRFQKSKRLLSRVKQKKIPKSFKAKLCEPLSNGVVAYGSPLVHQTHSEMKSLRAAKGRAIGRSQGGINPYLSMFVPGDIFDPELACAIHKCKFWRRYFRAFPQRCIVFLDKIATSFCTIKSGPAQALRKMFESFGWSCEPGGWLKHLLGFRFNWVNSSYAFLKNQFEIAWSCKIGQLCSHRKGFDIHNIDVYSSQRALHKLPQEDQVFVKSLLSGRHVTNDILCKFVGSTVTDKCNRCNQRDGKEHRFFQCREIASIRKGKTKIFNWVRNKPKALLHFGVLPLDLTLYRWKSDILPELGSNPIPPMSEHKTLFSDGSAFFVQSRLLAIAGSACVQCEINQTPKVVSAEILPTVDHTPFRAEVYAILLCMQHAFKCTICLDCEAAKQTLDFLLQMRAVDRNPKICDHWDLWLPIWMQILARPKYTIATRKVKAHVQWRTIDDPELRWISRANDCADRAAKRSVVTFLGHRFHSFEKKYKDFLDNIQSICDFYSLWVEINKECWVKDQSRSHCIGNDQQPELLHEPSRCISLSCNISVADIDGCQLGSVFAKRVCEYFNGLHWDFEADNVSIIELYFDFAIWTQSYVPFLVHAGKMGPSGPIKTFELKDQSILADIQETRLGVQSLTWHRAIKWLLSVWNNCPFHDGSIKVRSLHRYGYSIPHHGLTGRPSFRAGAQVHRALWGYFHSSTVTFRNLSRVWHVPPLASHGGS